MKLPSTHQTFPNFRLLCTCITETEKLPRSVPVQQLPRMKKLYPDIQCTQQLYAIVCGRWSKRHHLAVWRFLFYVRPITAETERSVVCDGMFSLCPTLYDQLRDSYTYTQSISYITLGTALKELLSKLINLPAFARRMHGILYNMSPQRWIRKIVTRALSLQVQPFLWYPAILDSVRPWYKWELLHRIRL